MTHRLLKFRGRCGDTWRKGDHLTYRDSDVIKHWLGSISPEYTVESETVGQFTGLYDCERKEIYEGDIIQINRKNFEVFYSQNLCAVAIKSPLQPLNKMVALSSKVVGNIHDSPELLKGAT